jgi:hypothetical protein
VPPADASEVDTIVAWDDKGRRSGVFVNTTGKPRVLKVSDWDERLEGSTSVLRVDAGTGDRVARDKFDGTVHLDAYGVAVATNATDTEMD